MPGCCVCSPSGESFVSYSWQTKSGRRIFIVELCQHFFVAIFHCQSFTRHASLDTKLRWRFEASKQKNHTRNECSANEIMCIMNSVSLFGGIGEWPLEPLYVGVYSICPLEEEVALAVSVLAGQISWSTEGAGIPPRYQQQLQIIAIFVNIQAKTIKLTPLNFDCTDR